MLEVVFLAHVDGLGGQHVGNGLLEAGGDVGHPELDPVALLGLDPPTHRRLETGEGVVEAVLDHVVTGRQPAREADGPGITLAGGLVDDRASWVGQAEDAGNLVVGLASGVVNRRTDLDDVGRNAIDPQQARVAARDEQGTARHRQVPVLEQVDGDVSGQVVDAVERLVEPACQRLGSRQTDDQSPGQTWTSCHCDAVELGQVHPCGVSGLLQHRDDRLQVSP